MFKEKKYRPKNIYKRDKKKYILDPIRKKLIMKTSEEMVRQAFINYLIEELSVPKDMIRVEVSMSYFDSKAKGRADIVVLARKENTLVPILVVECKAPKTPLIEECIDQVNRYEKILNTKTIAVTNGTELIVEVLNQKTTLRLNDLPKYKDLVSEQLISGEPLTYKGDSFEDYKKKSSLYSKPYQGVSNPKLQSFITNLNNLLWSEGKIVPFEESIGIKFIEDVGIRYTKKKNKDGTDWTGYYRSILIEDQKGDNQIISIAIIDGNLIVTIDGDNRIHTVLQLPINNFAQVSGNKIQLTHNGERFPVEDLPARFEKLLALIEEKEPMLLNTDKKVILGSFDISKTLDWEQESVKDFIGRLIKYVLIRKGIRGSKRKRFKSRRTYDQKKDRKSGDVKKGLLVL